MRRRGWVLAISMLVAVTTIAAERVHTVIIENMQFSPAALTVHSGDRVVWVNQDLFPHTATAADGVFSSPPIAAGASWTYQADRPGRHRYDCSLHPTMQGELTVE